MRDELQRPAVLPRAQPGCEDVELRLNLRGGNPGMYSQVALHVVQRERALRDREDLRPHRRAGREVEALGCHADDVQRAAADANRLPEDVRVGMEHVPPRLVAQDRVLEVVAGLKRPA